MAKFCQERRPLEHKKFFKKRKIYINFEKIYEKMRKNAKKY